MGKPLKLITQPLRSNIPILLGAEGPKNIALAFELCQGWIPLYFSPERPDIFDISKYAIPPDFEIAVNVNVNICDDVEEGLLLQKAILAFYIGGMGAHERNFHTELMGRMGYEKEAKNIAISAIVMPNNMEPLVIFETLYMCAMAIKDPNTV